MNQGFLFNCLEHLYLTVDGRNVCILQIVLHLTCKFLCFLKYFLLMIMYINII